MDTNQEEEITDEEAAQLESMQEMDSLGTDKYGYPAPLAKDSVFKFFKELLGLSDSSKVGNLTPLELGTPSVSVRGLQSIARYCTMEGLERVGNYFIDEAEIILSTSDSKKGFLAQLFVTQIKKEQKLKDTPIKKGWFAGKPKEGEE